MSRHLHLVGGGQLPARPAPPDDATQAALLLQQRHGLELFDALVAVAAAHGDPAAAEAALRHHREAVQATIDYVFDSVTGDLQRRRCAQ